MIRYCDNAGTLIPPLFFLPLLEGVELVDLIDFFVLDTVCQKIKYWLDKEMKIIPLSINFSIESLRGKSFVERILETCKKYQIPTKYIEIEGANHSQFANYGTYSGDGEALISSDEQMDITVRNIVNFLYNIH